MGCGCRKKKSVPITREYDVMGGHKYLTDRQIRARLEVYKKNFCKDCGKRYKCDYPTYVNCKKSNGNN